MIQEAQVLFDELVVAIGINPEKRNTYTIDERRAMLEAITGDFPNVRISVFENRFLVRYARESARVLSFAVSAPPPTTNTTLHALYQQRPCTRNLTVFLMPAARNRRSVFHYGQRPGRPRWLARHNTPATCPKP